MLDFIYNKIIIPLLIFYFRKIKKNNSKFIEREQEIETLWDTFADIPIYKKIIWIHSASMGEFEQIKPVIEELKKNRDYLYIVASFFSPSGYKNQQDYPYVDKMCYMPIDTKENAAKFVAAIHPDIAIFVRYEIWRNHLLELKKLNIPTILVNATMPTNNLYRTSWLTRAFLKENYDLFHSILTTGSRHTEFFEKLGINAEIRTLTDTRFDRIIKKVEEARIYEVLDRRIFDTKELVIVAGSIWEEDEKILLPAIKSVREQIDAQIKVIYVPHEPTEEHIDNLTNKIPAHALSSRIRQCLLDKGCQWVHQKLKDKDIIVDEIGYLLGLYYYGHIAYIGGAFGEGIHSVIEPAGFGLPIISGPNLSKSTDAQFLKKNKALKVVRNAKELADWLKFLILNNEFRSELGRIAKEYVYHSAGSSKIVADKIISILYNTEKE